MSFPANDIALYCIPKFMDHDSKPLNEHGDWLPCRPGAFESPTISLTERIAKRKPHLVSLSLIYFCGAMIFGTIIISWTGRPNRGEVSVPGEFSCQQVRRYLMDYSQMNIRDCSLRASISTHLSKCSTCDLIFQELAGNVVVKPSAETRCDFPQGPACDAQK